MNQFARPGLGATELPPVSADDNGKVLGVSDGAWAKVAASGGSDLPDDPAQDGTYNLQNTVSGGTSTLSWAGGSSGGGVLVVHASDAEFPVLDKTWTEIKNAWDGGSIVITVTADNDIAYLAAVPAQHGEDFLVLFNIPGSADMNGYVASSANGYPAQVFE